MYTSVMFSIFTELCNHHENLIVEHSQHLKKKPNTHQQSFPVPVLLPLSPAVLGWLTCEGEGRSRRAVKRLLRYSRG